VREKSDAELFAIDDVGAPEDAVDVDVEPPKKRRKPLKVDEILGMTDTKQKISSYIPKSQRPVEKKPEIVEEKETYDVWTKVDVIPAPQDLPPPAILPYSKSKPAQPPTTLRSTKHLLRPRETVDAVTVADGGQSYNPALEEWQVLINRKAIEEQDRLDKIAAKEWVPQPEDVETPAPEDSDEESEDEKTEGESFLAKPVQIKRKTQAQRNKRVRQIEQVTTRHEFC
jgi:hypothetical protein